MEIKELLQLAIDKRASDLLIVAGVPPTLRIDGVLYPIPNEGILTRDIIDKLVRDILPSGKLETLINNKEVDFSLPFSDKARFRGNAYHQKNAPAIVFRRVPMDIPSIEQLHLPKILHSFTLLKQGFVLVTGPTGHGKSSALAAMIEEINATQGVHIVTVEDPVEFIFRPKKSVVSQREMGTDTLNWKIALRSVLREDPNVVLIGEMRDYETIAAALTIAETGHLVFATLHTNSASQSIDRIVDVFPEEQQAQVRLQLSNVLEAVFSMRLVAAIEGGRLPAYEVMLGTSAIKTVIRDGKSHQIDSIIVTSQEAGMSTLEMSLANLVKEGRITLDVAQTWALRPEDLNRLART